MVMTTYYVGPGGNDGNDGLSWANRFLTLNGAEDEPVAAGDTVYVGPGVYRETLILDVNGSSGQPITYIGDVTGANTDGVGGVVRITGSNNDQSGTRQYGIDDGGGARTYRTFRGFAFDFVTSALIDCASTGSNDGWIIEDCYFGDLHACTGNGIIFRPNASDLITIRRCFFDSCGDGIRFLSASEVSLDASSVIENCIFPSGAGSNNAAISFSNVVNVTVKNCIIIGHYYGIETVSATTGTINVNNSWFRNCLIALAAAATGDLVEDYNSIPSNNSTPRSSVSTGSNSNAYLALAEMPQLFDGLIFPWNILAPSKWSQIARIAGTGESADDLYGITRPTTSAKKSWGAVQYQPGTRETTTTRGSSTASITFDDAGAHQIFVPVTAVSTTIEVYTYFETNHTGTKPQMIIKEPGQSDRTTTDTGSADTWNQLTDTFTPQSTSDYVVVELRSNNTATSGSYAVYFDDLSVS
jgi:hypothetical protein